MAKDMKGKVARSTIALSEVLASLALIASITWLLLNPSIEPLVAVLGSGVVVLERIEKRLA